MPKCLFFFPGFGESKPPLWADFSFLSSLALGCLGRAGWKRNSLGICLASGVGVRCAETVWGGGGGSGGAGWVLYFLGLVSVG